MRAIDTNILIYAEITTSTNHRTARQILNELSADILPWAIPWPCVYEFLRVVTHPKVFHPPVPQERAISDLQQILKAPGLLLLHETANHADVMMRLLEDSGVTGNLIHDAHIAALCIEHGVSELITGDRDFSRFPDLGIRNPFH